MLPFLLLVVMQMTLLQVSCGEKTKWETKETITTKEFYRKTSYRAIFAEVVHAPSKAAEVYECRLLGGDPAAAIYTWSRQDSTTLPDGVRAEGNRLYLMKPTSDLNGLYHCNITNKYDTYCAAVYIEIQDSTLYWIFKKASALWNSGVRMTTHTQEF
ncbi:hypothetical protein HF521_016059 [Silurus meridionalis]|uniref:Ig-like domain-containing protein n=1 Tax=Silurus meridionalis TaxID=175797 RepID=A0A8T0BQ44_SILME|nr:hypothetical protein HF521_016059 [Silurus meridionalis]